MKRFCLVTTTIRVPRLIESYIRDAKDYGRHLESVIIVGDRKTPEEIELFCLEIEKKYGTPVRYLSPSWQENYLKDSVMEGFIPWNCIQRRNLGLLEAYERDVDIVVTIDDDNFLCEPDYFGKHEHLGDSSSVSTVESDSGWWNVCEMLEDRRKFLFYHRGFPLSQRWKKSKETMSRLEKRVVVNAGLWLDDPDVDAFTRLCFPIRVKRSEYFCEKLACKPGTWSPFNSQNTALLKETIPAYFLFPHIGRYDDIWASYLLRHISDHLGDLITYGSPVVRQKRNIHNYAQDFEQERFGLEHNDFFLRALKACGLQGKSYLESYREIADQLPSKINEQKDLSEAARKTFQKVIQGAKIWTELFRD